MESPISPGIKIQDLGGRRGVATPTVQTGYLYPLDDEHRYKSPIRQHMRTPSQHRQIKETLNARSEYTSDDPDGSSCQRVNQYFVKEEIGRGSFGAVHLAFDQFGNEFAVKEFSKARLRKRAQSNILRQRFGSRGGRLTRGGGSGGEGRGGGGGGGGGGGVGTVRHPQADSYYLPRPVSFGGSTTDAAGGAGVAGPLLVQQDASEARDALFLIREEIAIMKKLNHPNLVQLIEVLDDPEEDTLYMVLEMCQKGVIMKVGVGVTAEPYSEESCRLWFRDLILGIEYLHSQGVVHRDIKPDNLLLTNDDVLKIVDFGVSEMFDKVSDMRTSKSAGSPAFLPPELCVARHGDISGPAADIWSMGVTLYCLRYGRIPFEHEAVLEVYEAIRTQSPHLPEGENPAFVDLMARLLEKDPAKRITMDELREHPWVTRGGEDLLLSAEENCSEPLDLPNELEVNHAFTRRMSHLLCVMKAISKFKGLLGSKGPVTPRHQSLLKDPSTSTPSNDPKKSSEDAIMSTAEHAVRVLRMREQFLKNNHMFGTGGAGGEAFPWADSANSATAPTPVPPYLGIGTGGQDELFSKSPSNQPPTMPTSTSENVPADAAVAATTALAAGEAVCESPSAVDFNVYDRAFDAEVERIKRSTSRGGGAGGARRAGSTKARRGTGTLFLTKLVNETMQWRMDDGVTWAGEPDNVKMSDVQQGPEQGQGQAAGGGGAGGGAGLWRLGGSASRGAALAPRRDALRNRSRSTNRSRSRSGSRSRGRVGAPHGEADLARVVARAMETAARKGAADE